MDKVLSLWKKHPGFRLARYELELYRDLLRWIRGHRLVPEDAEVLPHPPGRLQMLVSVISVLCVEMVVVHLLLPAGTVRLVALLLSIWGIVYVASLIGSERIRPSYVADDVTVLRRGKLVFAEIPASLIKQRHHQRTFASEVSIDSDTLTVGGAGGTDTLLELSEAIDVAGDRYPWQRPRMQPVTQIRYYAGVARETSASSR